MHSKAFILFPLLSFILTACATPTTVGDTKRDPKYVGKVDRALIILSSDMAENFNNDLLIFLRDGLNRRGAKSYSVRYDGDKLDQKQNIDDAMDKFKPHQVLTIEQRGATYLNGSLQYATYEVALKVPQNKGNVWSAIIYTVQAERFADKILDTLEEQNLIKRDPKQ